MTRTKVVFAALLLASVGAAGDASAQACAEMRELKIGVSVVPPNVVHTTPYVARDAGLFAKHCIEARIIAFEGGASAALTTGLQQGDLIANVSDIMVGNGMAARQIWGFAPRLPQSYVTSADVKTPADLKGRRLSAAGGGVGGFNWRMGRAMLGKAGFTVDDAVWVSQGLAGRLPGLVTGQLDGVSLHPEDVFLAKEQKPDVNVMQVLSDQFPEYTFNMYGAAQSKIDSERETLVDAVAAMMEANRLMYTDPEKVVPIIMKATEKPEAAVRFALKSNTDHCVWAVNTGFAKERAEWTIEFDKSTGDIPAEKVINFETLTEPSIADAALAKVGGPTELNGCKM